MHPASEGRRRCEPYSQQACSSAQNADADVADEFVHRVSMRTLEYGH